MENLYQDKRSGKLGVCKFLPILYQELQSYSKTSQWIQGKKGMEMGKRTQKGIQRVEEQNYKSTSTCTICYKTRVWTDFG